MDERVLTLDKLNNLIEQLRPKHAILLSDYIEDDKIFEIENYLPNKYYCKKLLLINTSYYENKLQTLFEKYGINLRVYK